MNINLRPRVVLAVTASVVIAVVVRMMGLHPTFVVTGIAASVAGAVIGGVSLRQYVAAIFDNTLAFAVTGYGVLLAAAMAYLVSTGRLALDSPQTALTLAVVLLAPAAVSPWEGQETSETS